MDEYKIYLFSYRFEEGQSYFQIRAKDANEAMGRLKALAWASYEGEIVPSAQFIPGRIFRLFDWIRGGAVKLE